MKLKTKFNIDDLVYYITNDKKKEPCTCYVCKGKKFVYISTEQDAESAKKSRCPTCRGTGKVTSARKNWIYEVGHVVDISININTERSITIKYTVENENIFDPVLPEKFVFATKEEAKQRCGVLNRIRKKKDE